MINIENVCFKYKNSDYILKNINFSVNNGEVIAIVGKNGSGKSTLGRLIAGITKLKEGTITIDNINTSKDIKAIREKVGIVFQNPENQIIFNNIYDELSFSLRGLEPSEIENRISTSLKQVDMYDFKDKDLYALSLGQKQRIMIAEILAKNPKYIILDEPTTMIDSYGKEKIHDIILDLKQKGYTIICITNLSDEILLADRTLILNNGEIVAEIKREELIDKYDILEKYGIKFPTLLSILVELKKDGIDLHISDFSVKELTTAIKEKLNTERKAI